MHSNLTNREPTRLLGLLALSAPSQGASSSLLRRSADISLGVQIVISLAQLLFRRPGSLGPAWGILVDMLLVGLGVAHDHLLIDVETLSQVLDRLLFLERLLDLAHEAGILAHGELEVVKLDLLPPRVVRHPRRLEADALHEVRHDLVENPHRLRQRRLAVAVGVQELRNWSYS